MNAKSPQPLDIQIGVRLKERRIACGLSQMQLGAAIGISYQQVQKYEDARNRMSVVRLVAVAKILKVPLSYFVGTDC